MTRPTSSEDAELLKLIEGFEHEYDVATEKLQITKPVFDGRIGDPSLVLKATLARFVKHHAKALLKQQTDAAALQARIDEITEVRGLALTGQEAKLNDYTAERIAQLQAPQGGKEDSKDEW